MIYGEIICLGDSLTEGSRHELGRGYPFFLETRLCEEHDQNWVCHNHGVAGETSYEILQRAYPVMSSYPDAKEVVINCGTNDAKVDEPDLEPYQFAEHVQAIVRRAKILGKRVFVTNIPPVKGFGAPDEIDEDILKEYNRAIEMMVWDKDGVHMVDWRGEVESTNWKNEPTIVKLEEDDYSDGVHFNMSGYRKLAFFVREAIEDVREY